MSTGSKPQAAIVSLILPRSHEPTVPPNTLSSLSRKSPLLAAGVEVIVDDRKERPGVKFADADLMGFPYQVVCGKKAIKNGNVELKVRATGERTEVAIDEVASLLSARVVSERA